MCINDQTRYNTLSISHIPHVHVRAERHLRAPLLAGEQKESRAGWTRMSGVVKGLRGCKKWRWGGFYRRRRADHQRELSAIYSVLLADDASVLSIFGCWRG